MGLRPQTLSFLVKNRIQISNTKMLASYLIRYHIVPVRQKSNNALYSAYAAGEFLKIIHFSVDFSVHHLP
jgi:hypothetical protein